MSTPTTKKLVFWADQTRAATTGTLTAIGSYNTLFVNLLTSPTGLGNYSSTALTLPYTGGYLFEVSGWRCGSGAGTCQVVVTRSGTTIYQRVRSSAFSDCSIFTSQFYWHLFQAGDIVTLYKNENTSGGTIGTTTTQISATDDTTGPVKIWFIPS